MAALEPAPGLSLRSCQTGTLVCDREGRIIWANPAVHDILGYPQGQLVKLNVEQALGRESHAFPAVLDILGGAPSIQGEIAITGRDGRVRYCDLLALGPVSTDQHTLQIMITEVPEDRRLERIARQVEREQAFLCSLCHELHISVEAVTGYIELLAADHQWAAGPLSELHARMRRLSTIVADLADLTAAGTVGRPLQMEAVNLEDIVEEAASAVYTEALRKQQRLIIDISEEAMMVRADPPVLRRLLVQLLDHAVGTTPIQGTVRVWASRSDGPCLVGVSDGGVPIEQAAQADLFRAFAGFHSEALRGDERGGRGLALAKQLVEAHGGSIWVEQPAEGGNTVCFSIPQ